MNRYGKAFWMTTFFHQNKHHKHGILVHTLKVTYHLMAKGHWKMIPAGILHDIAKGVTAYQDKKDIEEGNGDYSFTNHEIFGYQIIKDIPFISDYTKNLVRHHYLIRGMHKARVKNNLPKLRRLKRIWNNLDDDFKTDLAKFLVCDDLGKK